MTQLPSKVNPPVELENDGIVLNSGLDLTTASLQVDKGSLRDCLNIEVVDRLGYQVIGGFDRYDGSLSPDQVEFWVFETASGDANTDPGDILYDDDNPTVYFGVVVGVETTDTKDFVIYARYNSDSVIQSGTNVAAEGVGVVVQFTATSTAVRYVESGLFDPATDNAATTFTLFQ